MGGNGVAEDPRGSGEGRMQPELAARTKSLPDGV
jgi:hypothetical protein